MRKSRALQNTNPVDFKKPKKSSAAQKAVKAVAVTSAAVMLGMTMPWSSFSAAVPMSIVEAAEGYSFDSATGTLTITTDAGSTAWRKAGISFSAINTVVISQGVTSIGVMAFKDTSVSSVVIPEGVTTIGNYAFRNCVNLTSVTIPSTVTSVGNSAFRQDTALTDVTFANSSVLIGNYAFSDDTALNHVNFGNNLIGIGNYAFAGDTALTQVALPSDISSFNHHAFTKSSVTSFTIYGSTTVPAWFGYTITDAGTAYQYYVATSAEGYYETRAEGITESDEDLTISVGLISESPLAGETTAVDADTAGYTAFITNVISKIAGAGDDETVSITTDTYTSFNSAVIYELTLRPDVTLNVYYVQNGVDCSFQIPAGYYLGGMANSDGYVSFSSLRAKLSG